VYPRYAFKKNSSCSAWAVRSASCSSTTRVTCSASPLRVSRTNFRTVRTCEEIPASRTFHSLRHTFASWLATLGMDFKLLQELIGYRLDESTQTYVDAFNPKKGSAIEKLRLRRGQPMRERPEYRDRCTCEGEIKNPLQTQGVFRSASRTRTCNPAVNSRMLYH